MKKAREKKKKGSEEGPEKLADTHPAQGFRMLVGDPNMRSRPDTSLRNQNCYRCYTGPNFGGDTGAPCQDSRVDTETLPPRPCPGGIRSNIHFPT